MSSSRTETPTGGGPVARSARASLVATLVALGVVALLDLLPLLHMIALSARGGVGPEGAGEPVWGGPWIRLWRSSGSFLRWFGNSAAVAALSVGFHLVADSMAAYTLAKRPFRGSGLVVALIVLAMTVPRQATFIPLFLAFGRAGVLDTFPALVLPGLGDVIGVFLLRQFLLSVPDSLIEAARIDGASEWSIYSRIAMPLMAPALAVFGVLAFQHYWSDFFWPVVAVTSESRQTLQVGLVSMANPEFGVDLPLLAAGACAAAIPPLAVFLLLRNAFFEGQRGGATK